MSVAHKNGWFVATIGTTVAFSHDRREAMVKAVTKYLAENSGIYAKAN